MMIIGIAEEQEDEEGLAQYERDRKDYSYILAFMCNDGEPRILDFAPGFDLNELIIEGVGSACSDNGVSFPGGLEPGLYFVHNIKIGGGGPDYSGEYWGPDIDGDWHKITEWNGPEGVKLPEPEPDVVGDAMQADWPWDRRGVL